MFISQLQSSSNVFADFEVRTSHAYPYHTHHTHQHTLQYYCHKLTNFNQTRILLISFIVNATSLVLRQMIRPMPRLHKMNRTCSTVSISLSSFHLKMLHTCCRKHPRFTQLLLYIIHVVHTTYHILCGYASTIHGICVPKCREKAIKTYKYSYNFGRNGYSFPCLVHSYHFKLQVEMKSYSSHAT